MCFFSSPPPPPPSPIVNHHFALLCMQYCEKLRAVTLCDGISVINKSLFRLHLIPLPTFFFFFSTRCCCICARTFLILFRNEIGRTGEGKPKKKKTVLKLLRMTKKNYSLQARFFLSLIYFFRHSLPSPMKLSLLWTGFRGDLQRWIQINANTAEQNGINLFFFPLHSLLEISYQINYVYLFYLAPVPGDQIFVYEIAGCTPLSARNLMYAYNLPTHYAPLLHLFILFSSLIKTNTIQRYNGILYKQ